MTEHVDSILHLIALSFAVGLAYIALDRFRYCNLLKNKLRRALTEVKTIITEKNPAQLDTSVTRLEKKLKDISTNGVGYRLFYKNGPRAFGGGNKSGWDIYVIYVLLFLEYSALLFSCIGSKISNGLFSYIPYIMFGISAFGTAIPALFILLGNRQVHSIEAFISRVLEDVSDVYAVSINEMRDNLDKT